MDACDAEAMPMDLDKLPISAAIEGLIGEEGSKNLEEKKATMPTSRKMNQVVV
jgi:hypothetical protein